MPLYATAEEVACAAELAALDRADDAALRAEEWPDGKSSAGNTGAHCTTCHQLKTAGYADITDSRAGGSYTWRTA